MELKAKVMIRNRQTGSETVLCTGINYEDALKWVRFSLQTMDYNSMPEYVISPMIEKTTAPAAVRRETKYADMEDKVKVQKLEERI